jgi:hypothetical protein
LQIIRESIPISHDKEEIDKVILLAKLPLPKATARHGLRRDKK